MIYLAPFFNRDIISDILGYESTTNYCNQQFVGDIMMGRGGFLSHGRSPSHFGCFNTKSWSSMTWMIWGSPILGNLHTIRDSMR